MNCKPNTEPLDFAEELLPAAAQLYEKVSPHQVDQEEELEGREAEAPFVSEEGYFVKKPGKIRRFPFVYQIDEMDCGAASLAMLCRYYGRAVSLARIRQLLHTDNEGKRV